jgi:hypothetical protein
MARDLDRKARTFGRIFFAALSDPSWFKNMWRRFEQSKIHRPKNAEQVRQARLEGHPRCSVAGVRHAPRKQALHDVQVKADQGSFTALVPSRAFVRRVTCAHNR